MRLHTGKKWEAQKFAAFILHVHSADRVVSVHEEGASVHEEGYVKGKTEATCNMANIMVTSF